jgi:hypothetical protein
MPFLLLMLLVTGCGLVFDVTPVAWAEEIHAAVVIVAVVFILWSARWFKED